MSIRLEYEQVGIAIKAVKKALEDLPEKRFICVCLRFSEITGYSPSGVLGQLTDWVILNIDNYAVMEEYLGSLNYDNTTINCALYRVVLLNKMLTYLEQWYNKRARGFRLELIKLDWLN